MSDKIDAFEEACLWLEDETELHTLSEFTNNVHELSKTGESYCRKYQGTFETKV